VPILQRRNRLVYFRISEDEFRRFSDLCQTEGARSISDMARTAIQQRLADCSDPVALRLKALNDVLGRVDVALQRLTSLLEERSAPQTSSEPVDADQGYKNGGASSS
jgi:hypothetical protein